MIFGLTFSRLRVAQAEARGNAGAKALDHHVSGCDQISGDPPSFFPSRDQSLSTACHD